MIYPCVEINLSKIEENVKKALKDTASRGIDISCVSKVIAGDVVILERIINSGIGEVADSRLKNIVEYKDFNVRKTLIRIPMKCEIDEVVKYCDTALVSELETAKMLSLSAKRQNKEFEVIIMTDLGDLREGYFYEEDLIKNAVEISKLDNIVLAGVGTNWACYGGISPTETNLKQLCERKAKVENACGISLDVVSAGSSNCLHLLGKFPTCINHLRVGSAIFLGTGLNDEEIDGYNHDTFILKAQVVELKVKPSLPIGERCLNAFGKEVEFVDEGEILRAIIAVGRQDVDIEEMIPLDNNIKILGSSSDHIVLEVPKTYQVGDVISFKLLYPGILKSMTSKYVAKIYVD